MNHPPESERLTRRKKLKLIRIPDFLSDNLVFFWKQQYLASGKMWVASLMMFLQNFSAVATS